MEAVINLTVGLDSPRKEPPPPPRMRHDRRAKKKVYAKTEDFKVEEASFGEESLSEGDEEKSGKKEILFWFFLLLCIFCEKKRIVNYKYISSLLFVRRRKVIRFQIWKTRPTWGLSWRLIGGNGLTGRHWLCRN